MSKLVKFDLPTPGTLQLDKHTLGARFDSAAIAVHLYSSTVQKIGTAAARQKPGVSWQQRAKNTDLRNPGRDVTDEKLLLRLPAVDDGHHHSR